MRTALGAGRRHVAREVLVESLALSPIGGALGVTLAYAGVRVVVATAPTTLPRVEEISLDPRAMAFAGAASLLSCLLFGARPLLKQAARVGLLAGVRRAVSSVNPNVPVFLFRNPRTDAAGGFLHQGRRLNRDQPLCDDTTRGLRENRMHEPVNRRIAANHQGDEAHDRGIHRWCREECAPSITKIPTQGVQHRRIRNWKTARVAVSRAGRLPRSGVPARLGYRESHECAHRAGIVLRRSPSAGRAAR